MLLLIPQNNQRTFLLYLFFILMEQNCCEQRLFPRGKKHGLQKSFIDIIYSISRTMENAEQHKLLKL